jgi:hypothetical protein
VPTNFELRVEQKRRLAMLIRISNAEDIAEQKELIEKLITDTEIEMEAEDVAYVQKKLEKK